MKENHPVRILQIGMTEIVGGLETYLMQQFRHLDREKLTYDFINNQNEHSMAFENEIKAAGSRVYGIKSRRSNPLRHYWEWFCLMKKIHKDYEGIVLNVPGLTYIFPLVLARLFGIPNRIIHSHNGGYEKKINIIRKILIFFNRHLLKYCVTQYFACSHLAGEWMFGKNASVMVIHNAIETGNFIFNLEKRKKVREQMDVKDRFIIGHVARFSYQKNHMFLIDIFKAFHDKHPKAILWLIGGPDGDGSILKEVKEKVKMLHLDDTIQFLGIREDVPNLMQAMDCFVLPSRFEGLPVVGIEAQAAGLPCIISDKVTSETQITDLVKFASIDNLDEWTDLLNDIMDLPRRDTSLEIENAGYDISCSVKKIQQFYLEKEGETNA